MEKSQTIGAITKALASFRSELPEIKLNATVSVKTKTGGNYSFRYADLPHIKNVVEPILAKKGLFVSQFPEAGGQLTTLVSHESGEYLQATTDIGNIEGKTAQEYGSLITYFKRYSYCAALGIAADDDDDANASIGNDFEKITCDPSAPWLTDAQYNEAMAKLSKGERGIYEKLASEFKMKKVYKEALMKAEKESFIEMPKEKQAEPPKEPEKTVNPESKKKDEIVRDTDGWYKTVVWLAEYNGFFLDALEKIEANYIVSDENVKQLEKEAQILRKRKEKLAEPTSEEKAKKITKKGKEEVETV